MARLPQIQGDFQQYLLTGEADAVAGHVIGTENVPIETRLSIYGDGYRLRLIEALEANFPVLSELLGEEDFAALARAYIASHDSPFFSIRYYGHALAEFLAAAPEYAGAPVLAELARWEWTMTEVFDAADAEPVGHAALAQVPPDAWALLRFNLHPSVRRLTLVWNAPQIWKAVTDAAQPPEVALGAEPVRWLLWRRELSTYFRSLQPDEAAALDLLGAGETFGELCGALSQRLGEEQAPTRAAGLLREWVESGLLTPHR